jgi:hypothetical protein
MGSAPSSAGVRRIEGGAYKQAAIPGNRGITFSGRRGSVYLDTLLGGVLVSKSDYVHRKEYWQSHLNPESAWAETHRWQDSSDYAKQIYRQLDLPADYVGIPPRISPKGNDKLSTNGVLAQIAMEIVRRLPSAESLTEAVSQVEKTIDRVRDAGGKHYDEYEKANPRRGQFMLGPYMDLSTNIPIGPLTNRLFSAVQKSHIVMAAPNGAILVLPLPGYAQLAAMIARDPKAQAMIEKTTPLNVKAGDLSGISGRRMGAQATVDCLEAVAAGKEKPRKNGQGWSDRHTLVWRISLDYQDAVARGEIKPLVDKPGKEDGRSVLDWLADAPGVKVAATRPLPPKSLELTA